MKYLSGRVKREPEEEERVGDGVSVAEGTEREGKGRDKRGKRRKKSWRVLMAGTTVRVSQSRQCHSPVTERNEEVATAQTENFTSKPEGCPGSGLRVE